MQDITEIIWLQDARYIHVEQSLPGGDYISTGWFDPSEVSSNGRGRTVEACKGVTSLFFDVDAIGLVDALRQKRGQELESKIAGRKASMYRLLSSVEKLNKIKAGLQQYCIDELLELLGTPHAIIDSGWGFHLHYAVDESMRMEKEKLQAFHKEVVTKVNQRIQKKLKSEKGLDVEKAFDATNDVGARLARRPGSMNTKAPGNPKPVHVVLPPRGLIHPEDLPPFISQETLNRWYAAHPKQKPSSSKAPSSSSSSSSSRPSSSTIFHRDFRLESWPAGGTWQDMADATGYPGRMNVICPFAGSSIGSAFFVCEADGRSRLVSNAQNRTYINSYNPLKQPKRPTLVSMTGEQRTFADLTMKTDRQGNLTNRPESSDSNLLRVLEEDSSFDLWENTWSHRTYDGPEPITDSFWMSFRLVLEQDYNWQSSQLPGKDRTFACVKLVGMRNQRNPVETYLRGLQWDGVSRVSHWVEEVICKPCEAAGCSFEPDEKTLYNIYGYRWLISAAARALEPGCKVDTVLCIVGRQGFRKSTIFKSFCPDVEGVPSLFCSSPLPLSSSNADKYLMLYQAWIYEDAEMASGKRSDNETKKAFLSQASDNFRRPYGSGVELAHRHTVMVGTSNEASVLKDSTGNRRYWIIEAPRLRHLADHHPAQPAANVDWLEENREQLLAEAVSLYLEGEQWWLTELEDFYRGEHNTRFSYQSTIEEMAELAYQENAGGRKNGFTTLEFARAMDAGIEISAVSSRGMTYSAALKNAGFENYKTGGKNKYWKNLGADVSHVPSTGLEAVSAACQSSSGGWQSWRSGP